MLSQMSLCAPCALSALFVCPRTNECPNLDYCISKISERHFRIHLSSPSSAPTPSATPSSPRRSRCPVASCVRERERERERESCIRNYVRRSLMTGSVQGATRGGLDGDAHTVMRLWRQAQGNQWTKRPNVKHAYSMPVLSTHETVTRQERYKE